MNKAEVFQSFFNKVEISDFEINNISINSKELDKNDIFVAIRGGNNFVNEALEKGAFAVYDSKTLKIDEKYYLTDHGFRQAIGFSNTKDIERTLENIVCIELISRGYEVKIGKVKDKEIDFIAKKGKELSYYQISYIMGDEKTREREFGVYKSITDNFPKYVLSMDHFNFSQDGIIHKNIIDFLLENEGTR